MKVLDRDTVRYYLLENSTELLTDLEAFRQNECKHDHMAPRRVVVKGGAIQIRNQCPNCGQLVGMPIKQSLVPENCENEDVKLRENYDAQRKSEREAIDQKHVRKQREANSGFRERYSDYLNSEIWKSKRAKVLQRAANICEGCLEVQATEVHHLTYAHVFDELLYELVALCDDCHSRSHRYEPSTEMDHGDLPCDRCQCGEWDDEDNISFCIKFSMTTGSALAPDGPCGPDANELEPIE